MGALQIPPLRYASVGMTKGRVALPFRFDTAEDEQQVPPLRLPGFPVELEGIVAPSTQEVDAARAIVGLRPSFSAHVRLGEHGAAVDSLLRWYARDSAGHVLSGIGLIWRLHRVAIWTHIFSEMARCTRNSPPRM
jgi:hypothetical protein